MLRIDPLAVLVLRADQHGRRGAHRRNTVAGHGAVTPEHEDVVAQNLKIVLRKVSGLAAFVVPVGHLTIRLHR